MVYNNFNLQTYRIFKKCFNIGQYKLFAMSKLLEHFFTLYSEKIHINTMSRDIITAYSFISIFDTGQLFTMISQLTFAQVREKMSRSNTKYKV